MTTSEASHTAPPSVVPGATQQALVIGSPIAHSRSPLLHNTGYAALGLTDWEYGRAECTAAELPNFVAILPAHVRGISVTMPCKFAALEYASEATPRAQAIGSANTLVRLGDSNQWRADNTDVDGVTGCLQQLFDADLTAPLRGRTAVIFGSGGTARPAIWACASAGIAKIVIVNRRDRAAEFQDLQAHFPEVTFEFLVLSHFGVAEAAAYPSAERAQLIQLAGEAAVAINTIPAGNTAGFAAWFAQVPTVDVIYDPWPTPLYAQGERVVGGHIMLAYQAFEQFVQFTGHEAPRRAMLEALAADLNIPLASNED